MSFWNYVVASLWHYRRIHLAVAAGVAIAAAVITGALLVGDSMRGSLRDLVHRSLGRIEYLIVGQHPFRANFYRGDSSASLLITQGSLSASGDGQTRRAAGLSVVGYGKRFWEFGIDPGDTPTKAGFPGVALSSNIADELGVEVGDDVLLRVPIASSIPADSTLGEKEDAIATRRFEVGAILPNEIPLVSFSLSPNQHAPRNVFVPLGEIQELLELEGRVNTAALAGQTVKKPLGYYDDAIALGLSPKLIDFGISVRTLNDRPNVAQIEADRLVLSPHLVDVAQQLYGEAGIQPVVSYLANTIAIGDKSIPYSIVTGVDSTAALGPLIEEDGQPIVLADDEIALNDWAADQLDAKIGDEVVLRYYDPETTHGELREQPPLRLKLRAIVPLANDQGESTLAADAQLTPELPGVTDQASINNWELPFKLVEPIDDDDEEYWDDYRTTPKAFVSFSLARQLWTTRWGSVSLLRVPMGEAPSTNSRRNANVRSIGEDIAKAVDPAKLGMTIIPVKRRALEAATGTTPFDALFLGFSCFLMASAVLLVALLFRLGIEQRASEAGLLLAAGVSQQRVRRLMLTEGALVAVDAAAAGAAIGVGYAWLMIYGLNNWWVEATVTPFLQLHVTPRSVLIGWGLGVVVALLAMWFSLRKLQKLPARQLLTGDSEPRTDVTASGSRLAWLPGLCLLAAAALSGWAWSAEGEAQAGAFFGGGALVLVGLLLAIHRRLRAADAPTSFFSLAGLALRNIRRNPTRTILAIGLAAAASFLIVALSAFRLQPTDAGTGGFDLLANSALPLHHDLNTVAGRQEFGFGKSENTTWGDASAVGFRVHAGDDASCLNLFQSMQPRILGVADAALNESKFEFAATADHKASPWSLLTTDLGLDEDGRPVVPMILDRNTAFYSLKLYRVGDRFEGRDAMDQPVAFEVVGMLANSVLQGDLIIGEEKFLQLFPEAAGQRFFLVRSGPNTGNRDSLAATLESQLEDYGFDAIDARRRLAEFMAVQNTYLSTFQSLGLLGLLLGAVGLAVVQLRSVLERRGELALMQAQGFRRSRLANMVLAENLALLLGGLAIGCVAALAAVLPHAAASNASIPWGTLTLLLGGVVSIGIFAGWRAIRAALRAPLLSAIRGD